MTLTDQKYLHELQQQIFGALNHFRPVSLNRIDAHKLMARYDEKYIFHSSIIPGILEQSSDYYYVLEINKKRLLNYRSLYIDTTDHSMYINHHNGKRNRYKIRIREYCDTDNQFLEIKIKDNKGQINKIRIPTKSDDYLSEKKSEFIIKNTPYHPRDLSPKLSVSFTRITMSSKTIKERITLDTAISFEFNGEKVFLPFLGVIEIKKENPADSSEMFNILRSLSIIPESFSKYCIGTALVYRDIKKNRFKPVLIKINKLKNENVNF